MTETAPVACHVASGVAHVELNRPDSFNALDVPLARALYQVLVDVAADDDVKTVLLSGRGRAFCAGGDVKLMASATDVRGAVRELAHAAHEAVLALARLDVPVIAVVHGSVAGGGVGLTCAADLVMAAESARFVAAYPGIAVTPDCSLSWALPRIVGERRALELMLLNEPVKAATAREWGLVTAVHPDEEVLAAGLSLAQSLASSPAASALGHTRRLVRDSAARTLEAQLEIEAATIADFAGAPESRDLVRAFTKR